MTSTAITLITIIALGIVLGEMQAYQEEINAYLQKKKTKAKKSKAAQFYSSAAWRKARVECFKLQMARTGHNYIECEQCGATSMDIDDSGKKVVMSVGHDKARSTHEHLALIQKNLFPQCFPCNIGQGTEQRIR